MYPGATRVLQAEDGSIVTVGDPGYDGLLLLATAPSDPCQWDDTIEASDPACVEPEPEPPAEPVGCDAMVGLVDTGDGGCALLVRVEPEWTEVGMVFAMAVLVALGALVVAQLVRR